MKIKFLKNIPPFFYNKYFLTLLAVTVWVSFFDQYNLLYQSDLNEELQSLEARKMHYQEDIRKDSIATFELLHNMKSLEKYGREQYLMKRDNEDIFLIVDERTKTD